MRLCGCVCGSVFIIARRTQSIKDHLNKDETPKLRKFKEIDRKGMAKVEHGLAGKIGFQKFTMFSVNILNNDAFLGCVVVVLVDYGGGDDAIDLGGGILFGCGGRVVKTYKGTLQPHRLPAKTFYKIQLLIFTKHFPHSSEKLNCLMFR